MGAFDSPFELQRAPPCWRKKPEESCWERQGYMCHKQSFLGGSRITQNHRAKSFSNKNRARIFPGTVFLVKGALQAVSGFRMGACQEPTIGHDGHGFIQGISLADLANITILGGIGFAATGTDDNSSLAALSQMFLSNLHRA